MDGYRSWIISRVLFALMGTIVVWAATMGVYGSELGAHGRIADISFAILGVLIAIDCLADLLLKSHEGTFILTVRGDAAGRVDFSRDIKFYFPKYGNLVIPGGFTDANSHIKVYWKRGMNPRVLTANEWFNY